MDSLIKHQQGVGLAELMISFLLSSVLMMILLQHVIQVKRQSQAIAEVIDRSLELHWVSGLIQARVRAAGFTPCLRLDHLVRFDARANPESLEVMEVQAMPQPRLTIRRMDSRGEAVRRQISARELLMSSNVVREHQPILIADCQHAEVHETLRVEKQVDGDVITLKEPLMFTYDEPLYVGEWISESFFIQPTSEKVPALFYQHHRVEQLTQRVQHFSATLIHKHGYVVLNLVLWLENNGRWRTETVVRAR
jgi:hypothetical protein